MQAEDRDWQRLDKWLWCARFMRHRADCTRLVAGGLVRINRQPTDKPHARLRVGDVLTLPLRERVVVVEVLAMALRRGPPAEARRLFLERAPGGGGCGAMADGAYPPPEPAPPGVPDDLRGH